MMALVNDRPAGRVTVGPWCLLSAEGLSKHEIGSTAKGLAKHMLKCYGISWCVCSLLSMDLSGLVRCQTLQTAQYVSLHTNFCNENWYQTTETCTKRHRKMAYTLVTASPRPIFALKMFVPGMVIDCKKARDCRCHCLLNIRCCIMHQQVCKSCDRSIKAHAIVVWACR